MTDTDTVWVCVDCYYAHHGLSDCGEVQPQSEPLALLSDADVTAGLFYEQHDCDSPEQCSGECEVQEFSWSRCEGCGSRLGGSRHALTVWYEEA